MEILRPDFLRYIDEIRQSLFAIQTRLDSEKFIDEIDCIDRILCLFEAEQDYRGDHLGAMLAELDDVVELLRPLLDSGKLPELQQALARLRSGEWPTADARLAAYRQLLQGQMPALAALADAGEVAAKGALQRLLDDETRRLQRIHERRRARYPLPERKPEGGGACAAESRLDPAALQRYLRDVFPDEHTLTVTGVSNIPGGRSKETTLIDLGGVRALPARIVMRSDVEGGLVPSRTVDEFHILQIVEGAGGVPVPQPLHCETDKSRLGSSFLLMAAVPGSTQGAYNPDVRSRLQPPLALDRHDIGRQLARILARLHRIDVARFRDTHLDTGIDLRDYVKETIDGTYRQAASFDEPSRVHIETAYHWLNANLHLADDDLCLIHCDIGLHNMLVEEGRITALLDWELACMASPAREIAKILHLIDFLMPREQFFRAYLDAGGSPGAVEPDRLSFYAVMNYMVTNQRARYANHLFFTGQRSNIVMANAGYDSCYRVASLLANALRNL